MTAPVLALDAFLTSLSVADIEAMRKAAPQHLLDQFDAATADVDKLVRFVGRGLDSTAAELAFRQIPEWVRLSVADTLLRFHRGTHDTCMHNPSPSRPEPIVAAAWRPGLVTCVQCVHLFKMVGDPDRTCDHCGHVCAGIHSCTLSCGALIFSYGLCSGCLADHKAVGR